MADEDLGPLLGLPADMLFERRVYVRGALTLEALRRTVGDDVFFGILESWVDRHGGRAAGTDDFLDLVGEAAGTDARDLVERWLTQSSMPDLPTN